MSRYISMIVRSAHTVHMKRINLNKVLFFSQSIHLILAGLIFNTIPFFLGIFFSILRFFKKKKIKIKTRQLPRLASCWLRPCLSDQFVSVTLLYIMIAIHETVVRFRCHYVRQSLVNEAFAIELVSSGSNFIILIL